MFKLNDLKWTREPAEYAIGEGITNHILICGKECTTNFRMTMPLYYKWKQMRNTFHLLLRQRLIVMKDLISAEVLCT